MESTPACFRSRRGHSMRPDHPPWWWAPPPAAAGVVSQDRRPSARGGSFDTTLFFLRGTRQKGAMKSARLHVTRAVRLPCQRGLTVRADPRLLRRLRREKSTRRVGSRTGSTSNRKSRTGGHASSSRDWALACDRAYIRPACYDGRGGKEDREGVPKKLTEELGDPRLTSPPIFTRSRPGEVVQHAEGLRIHHAR